MTTRILVHGQVRTIAASDEMFTRTLPLAGSTVKSQRSKRHIGNVVNIPGIRGYATHTIVAVSTDGLSWRDQDGTEHLTCNILLLQVGT